MSARASSLLIVAALPLGSCAIQMDLPQEFLVLQTSGDQLKATTPEDARVWVREFADPDGGTLDFWAATLKNDLIDNRGYRLQREDDVQDGSGRPGRLMELLATVGGEQQGYLVAVFTVPGMFGDSVRVLEFAARKEVYDRHVESVRAAISTLQP